MLQRKVLLLTLVLAVLPLAVTHAAPPPPCTCELCLADPEVQCDWKVIAEAAMTSPAGDLCLPEASPPAADTEVTPSPEPLELAPGTCPPDEECNPPCLFCTTNPQCEQLCPSGVGRCVQSTGCCMCMIS